MLNFLWLLLTVTRIILTRVATLMTNGGAAGVKSLSVLEYLIIDRMLARGGVVTISIRLTLVVLANLLPIKLGS